MLVKEAHAHNRWALQWSSKGSACDLMSPPPTHTHITIPQAQQVPQPESKEGKTCKEEGNYRRESFQHWREKQSFYNGDEKLHTQNKFPLLEIDERFKPSTKDRDMFLP